jgi:hypothetical protein
MALVVLGVMKGAIVVMVSFDIVVILLVVATNVLEVDVFCVIMLELPVAGVAGVAVVARVVVFLARVTLAVFEEDVMPVEVVFAIELALFLINGAAPLVVLFVVLLAFAVVGNNAWIIEEFALVVVLTANVKVGVMPLALTVVVELLVTVEVDVDVVLLVLVVVVTCASKRTILP